MLRRPEDMKDWQKEQFPEPMKEEAPQEIVPQEETEEKPIRKPPVKRRPRSKTAE